MENQMKKVAIVLPCYNEAAELKDKVSFLKNYLEENVKEYNFTYIIADDCSSDDTKAVAESIPGVHCCSYPEHHGKGAAVKNGIQYALKNIDFDYLIFMDIDLSTELSATAPLLKELENCPFVLGSRYDKESKILIKQPLSRRMVSKFSRIIIKMMFHLHVKDSQCGFKGMNKETAKFITDRAIVEQFAFDVEYLYILKLNKIPYKSVPVRWNDDRDSRVKVISSSVKFFKDLFKLKRKKKLYVAK